jgi:hypothetical protein
LWIFYQINHHGKIGNISTGMDDPKEKMWSHFTCAFQKKRRHLSPAAEGDGVHLQ